MLLEVVIPDIGHCALIGAVPPRSPFSVASIKSLDYVHAVSDFAERRKTLTIKHRVVAIVDENLCSPCFGTTGRERHCTRTVTLFDGVVLDGEGAPIFGHFRIAVDAPLDDE